MALACQKVVRLSWLESSFAALNLPDECIVVANDRIRVYEVLPLSRSGIHFPIRHRRLDPRPGHLLGPEQASLFGTPLICTINKAPLLPDPELRVRFHIIRNVYI